MQVARSKFTDDYVRTYRWSCQNVQNLQVVRLKLTDSNIKIPSEIKTPRFTGEAEEVSVAEISGSQRYVCLGSLPTL